MRVLARGEKLSSLLSQGIFTGCSLHRQVLISQGPNYKFTVYYKFTVCSLAGTRPAHYHLSRARAGLIENSCYDDRKPSTMGEGGSEGGGGGGCQDGGGGRGCYYQGMRLLEKARVIGAGRHQVWEVMQDL